MRFRPKKILIWLLGLGAAAYLIALAALYVFQRDFLYQPPQDFRTAPAAAGLPEAQEVTLTTRDGEKVIAWYVPPREGKHIVVFFHGNGDTIALRAPRLRAVIADGTGLVALSFRGYAGSSGHPTEQGLIFDALAAYDFAAARFAPERIVVWGFSLGTGPAVAVASERPVGKLILEAPYTSTADVAASDLPFIPVRLLMTDQFHSDERIGKVHAPLLVMHGGHDPGINIRFGRRLFALANEPKRFVEFPEGGHFDLDDYGASSVAMKFVNE
jgi:fermentation-respiration switch protein FrsA (DUF1100 family)